MDIHQLNMDNNIRYVPGTAKDILHKLYIQNKESKISVKDIIKEHNKKWFCKVNDEQIEEVSKILQEDETFLADFEVKDGYLQRIDYKPYTCEFVTSGRIVVENDLRDFFEDVDVDVDGTKGIIQTMECYAKQQMLHGFVGNSCPSIYLNKKLGIIHIGTDYDNENDEPIIAEGFEELTSVCTDLWWYSIMDVEVLKSLDSNFNEDDYNIVEIPAGTWKLTHKYGISERGYHENLPYATLELLK